MAGPKRKPEQSPAVAYERDFFGWTVDQADALRTGRLRDLDLDRLAEVLTRPFDWPTT